MKILHQQIWHFIILIALLIGTYYYVDADPSILEGEYLGISTCTWFIMAILSPIIHQIYVLVCWRSELFHQSISKAFGAKGFKIFKIGFAILIISRLITIIILAIASADTLNISPILSYTFATILFIPSAYLGYSVKKYFGINRAIGIDHFRSIKDSNEPFVKKGIFKYTSNGMYIYGFMLLWIPGLLLFSKAALIVALFNHIYIWVHYYFTELPDIKTIYKDE
jgi:hypothetical protein